MLHPPSIQLRKHHGSSKNSNPKKKHSRRSPGKTNPELARAKQEAYLRPQAKQLGFTLTITEEAAS
jgi:hypothetical protein